MKIFATILVFISAFSAFAQTKSIPDFSGKWELDIQKSKLDPRSRIESMTMTVSQTQKELKIETNIKRQPMENQDLNPGFMRGGAGFGFSPDTDFTYSLDGKETEKEVETPFGPSSISLKAEFNEKESKLKLTQKRTVNSPMGEITLVSKETWKLSEDGKTLTVKREIETPRGLNVSELVFSKVNP